MYIFVDLFVLLTAMYVVFTNQLSTIEFSVQIAHLTTAILLVRSVMADASGTKVLSLCSVIHPPCRKSGIRNGFVGRTVKFRIEVRCESTLNYNHYVHIKMLKKCKMNISPRLNTAYYKE